MRSICAVLQHRDQRRGVGSDLRPARDRARPVALDVPHLQLRPRGHRLRLRLPLPPAARRPGLEQVADAAVRGGAVRPAHGLGLGPPGVLPADRRRGVDEDRRGRRRPHRRA
ncbi:hypothetical protein ACFSTC_21850 [Nonomuraea ferruginea]